MASLYIILFMYLRITVCDSWVTTKSTSSFKREVGLNYHHRRDILRHFIGSIPYAVFLSTAEAQTYPQETTDKQKIIQGYKRLEYLLNHWQELTTVCKASVDNPVRSSETHTIRPLPKR